MSEQDNFDVTVEIPAPRILTHEERMAMAQAFVDRINASYQAKLILMLEKINDV